MTQSSDSHNNPSPYRWLGYGIEFIGVLAIFTYGGWWLDQKRHHDFPWFMLLGLMIALIGMIYLLVKETRNES